jgi:glycosyltransferase involved in cell wall biosynthesis
MNKKIVIGIPSYNEEDTINYVVRQIDLGLKKFFPKYECLIVNVDSDSTDNTKKIFLKTNTFSPKKYLNTGQKIRGKGKNLIELFKYCNKLNVDYIALFDSDIKSIKPNWVFSLLSPLITKNFDYTTPVYSRGCYDGNVTNNFASPLTYAIFGIELQQPIGGEFGLNKRLYKYLLQQPIGKAELGFGIDIFMTYHAIGGGFKLCEVYLGKKKHKPGFPTLMDKFLQFAQSAVAVSRIYIDKLNKIKPVKKCKKTQIFKTRKQPNKKLVLAQLNQFSQEFRNNILEYHNYLGRELTERIDCAMNIKQFPELSTDIWIEALARFLKFCYSKDFKIKLLPKICGLIAPIFYWRAISFWGEMKDLNSDEINKKIRRQGKLLRKKLIDKSIIKI